MYKQFLFTLLVGSVFPGCGGGLAPTQRLADAQSAERSARELGASNIPQAQLPLKLAQQQIAAAEKKIADDEYEEAERLLTRAKADAELAVALAREHDAKLERQKAVAASSAQDTANMNQGAVK